MNALENCVTRVDSHLAMFKEQIKKEKHDFKFLKSLRESYQLSDLNDDPYLSPKI